MNNPPSSLHALLFLGRGKALIAALIGSALLFGISPPRLTADPSGLTPSVAFTQGLVGTQVRLQWVSQPGVRYVIQKSPDLSVAGGFAAVALVTTAGTVGQWVDPVAAGAKGFYRIEIPAAQVFALEPPVLSTAGGDIFVRAQCLPPGSFLKLEIPGQPPIFVELVPVAGQPGLWRASFSAAVAGGIAGGVVAGRVVDANGVTVCLVDQTIEVTGNGLATDAPPWLPPAAPVGYGQVNKAKSNLSNNRSSSSLSGIHGEVCDDGGSDDEFARFLSKRGYDYYQAQSQMNAAGAHTNPFFKDNTNQGEMPGNRSASLLMPALMKAKEKANRINGGSNRDGGSGSRDYCVQYRETDFDFVNRLRGSKRSEAENTIGAFASLPGGGMSGGKVSYSDLSVMIDISHRGLPGEVIAEQCDLALPCPAGPPLEWKRTYRSKAPLTSGHGSSWDFSYNIYLEPIPLAAGVNAPQVAIHSGDGRRDLYQRQADGTYRCGGMFREGRFNKDTSFTLTFADQGTWIFCQLVGAPWSGRIGSITDRNGVALTFTYNSGQLATVSDAFGRSLAVSWGPTGQISRVSDFTGRSVFYSYYGGEPGGSAGDLKAVSCPQVGGQAPVCGPTTYTYTSGFTDDRLNHNLASATDGAGRNLGAITYSTEVNPAALEFDTVASVSKGATIAGNLIVCRIGPPPPGGSNPSVGYVVYENDELGRVTETTCDRMHRPISIRQYTGFATPGLPVTATTNRPAGKLRAADPDVYETTFAYNAQNCCTVCTEPDGLQTRCTYQYDLSGAATPVRERGNARVCTLVSPGGEPRTVSMTYLPGFGACEGSGCYKSATLNVSASPGGTVCALIRESPTKQSLGVRESPTLQSLGGLRGSPIRQSPREPLTLQSLLRESPSKQSLGRLRESPTKQKMWMCANFRTSLTTTYGQKFTCAFDLAGNCTSSRTPIAGAGEDCAYNSLGQLTSVTTLNGPGSSFLDECVYDPATHFCTNMVSDGTGLHLTVSCARDVLGRVTSETDERGFDTLFTYNPLDECVTVQSPVVGTAATGASRITTTCFYDQAGLPSGFDVEHRDATGALVATNPAYSVRYLRESPSRPRVVSRVAVENRPVSLAPGSTDIAAAGLANFDVCDFTFDAAGQCIQETTPAVCRAQPTNAESRYLYDERGLLYLCLDGLLGAPDTVTTECDYTPAGELSRCVTFASAPAASPTETYLYDGFRRCISSTDPMGNVETYSYDNQGYVTCSRFGELDDVAGSAGNVLLARVKVQFHWDRCDNSSGWVETVWNKQCVEKDTIVRLAGQDSNSRSAFFDVFLEDNTCTVERFTPGAAAAPVLEITTCDRSPAGLVQSVSTNGDLLVSHTYDSAGRPMICSNGACALAFTLDACGNAVASTRTDLSSAGGGSHLGTACATTYDSIGRPVQMSEGSNVSTCDFDSLGRVTRCSPPTGAPIEYDYDGGTAAQPYCVRVRCDVQGTGTLQTLGSVYVRRGMNSNVRSTAHLGVDRITNSNGDATTFTRDSQGRCVQTDFPDGTHESSTFDNLGRMATHTRKNGALIAANYDYKDRVTSVAISDPDPNIVQVPLTTWGYNGKDDCIRHVRASSAVFRSFDSCGNLLSESQSGHTVQHTYSHRGRISTTYPDGSLFYEVRNEQGLLISCSAQGSTGPAILTVQYQGYRPLVETRANGVVTACVYRGPNDAAIPDAGPDLTVDDCVQSTITGPTGTVLSRSTYTRDGSQRLIRCDTLFSGLPVTSSPLRRQVITRDRLGRLIRMQIGTRTAAGGGALVLESDVSYTLDLEGQRLTATGGTHPGQYVSSSAVPPGDRQMTQYTAWPDGALVWNDNGSLTSFAHGAAGAQQLVYDACGRLMSVVDGSTGATVASYRYDACDRLISRSLPGDAVNPPSYTTFIYDGDRCIQELGSDGLPDYTLAGIGHCIISRNGTYVYPHGGGAVVGDSFISSPGGGMPHVKGFVNPGAMPHVKLMTGSTGATVENFEVDDGGRPIFLTSEGLVRPGATTALSGYKWMVPECLWCPESGLFDCTNGNYSPDLGTPVSYKEAPKPKPVKQELHGTVSLLK